MKRASAFPDLVTAMSDPRLFGPMFAGPSWDNWRAILRAALGLPMSAAEVTFFLTLPVASRPAGASKSWTSLQVGEAGRTALRRRSPPMRPRRSSRTARCGPAKGRLCCCLALTEVKHDRC